MTLPSRLSVTWPAQFSNDTECWDSNGVRQTGTGRLPGKPKLTNVT